MAKKIVEEVAADVVSEVTVEETPVVEAVEAPKSLGFLHMIRGKEVISVEFGDPYILVKDAEGTGYTLPRQEYLDLLACE